MIPDALEADHDFLLEGDVVTKDVETWIDWKRKNEADPIRGAPDEPPPSGT